jgi:hypothetical protein
MSDTLQIILGACFLIGVFVLTRFGIGWKMARAAQYVIKDLESQGAVDPVTAVALPYAKLSPIRIGMRDYHNKALEYLVTDGTVGRTSGGKYYLLVRPADKSTDRG